MLTNLLQRLFSSAAKKNDIDERQLREYREYEASHSATVDKQNADIIEPTRKDATTSIESPYAGDIVALEEHFGTLHDGMVLEVGLRTLLSICPRERRKSDSFKGLKSQLRRIGVTLSIVNTPKHNN